MGKHQAGTRLIGTLLRGLVVLLAVGLVGSAGWYVLRNNSAEGAEGGCPTTLHVVTAASFATVVSAAGRTLRGGDDCILVDTTSTDGRPAGGQLTQSRADLWIPDDAAWDVIAPPQFLAKKDTLNAYATLATSPIYMVTDPATGDRITAGGGSWLALSGLLNTKSSGVRMVVRNPAMSGDGMVAAGAVGEAVWLEKGMDASSLVLTNVLGVTRTVNHDLAAIPEAAGEVGLIPEYALLATLRLAKSDRRYIVGTDRTALLRYTWLPSAAAAADPKRAAALRRLYAAFSTPEGSRAMAEAGLRGPDNLRPLFDGANVLPEPTAKPFDVLQPHHVQHIFATWDPEDRRSNLLIVVDLATNSTGSSAPTGGSSASPPPGKVLSPIDVLRNGCLVLSGLMPVGSRLGLWEVNPGNPGFRKLMPTDRLDDASRAAFEKQVGKLAAHRTGPGLLDTLVAAYQSVRDDYHDDMFNQVLVFTDDQNKDSANTAAVDAIVQKLTALQDPSKPVKVSVVVLGKKDSADRLKNALKPIDAYVDNALNADDVQAAFIHVVAGGLHE